MKKFLYHLSRAIFLVVRKVPSFLYSLEHAGIQPDRCPRCNRTGEVAVPDEVGSSRTYGKRVRRRCDRSPVRIPVAGECPRFEIVWQSHHEFWRNGDLQVTLSGEFERFVHRQGRHRRRTTATGRPLRRKQCHVRRLNRSTTTTMPRRTAMRCRRWRTSRPVRGSVR